jgi:hypothetical protein
MKMLVLLLTVGIFAPALAQACGVCVEDRMAATYDHELVTRAISRGHQVVFTDVSGPASPTPAQWHMLARAVQNVDGVIKGSVRTSKSPTALSFEIDPKASAAATAITGINERIGKQPLRVSLIRTISQQEVAAR